MQIELEYQVRKVYKDFRPSEVIEDGLTKEEAIELVKEDIEINPDCEEYMLVFDSYEV